MPALCFSKVILFCKPLRLEFPPSLSESKAVSRFSHYVTVEGEPDPAKTLIKEAIINHGCRVIFFFSGKQALETQLFDDRKIHHSVGIERLIRQTSLDGTIDDHLHLIAIDKTAGIQRRN